jgi:GT2 family glycosyltransferase
MGVAGGGAGRSHAPCSSVTAVLACYNRRELTLRCLDSYFAQQHDGEAEVVLVDDASTDGTAEAVRERFPSVTVVLSHGNLYWAAGMALACRHAIERRPDYLLWLNDDTVLAPNALQVMLRTHRASSAFAVVSGALRAPSTGRTSYGGVRRRGGHPMQFDLVEPGEAPQVLDTVHGNVLLVPNSVYDRVSIDGSFAHAYADFDFGLRVRQAGGICILAPGYVGDCESNAALSLSLAAARGWRQRLRVLNSPKGLPVRSQVKYLWRHGGTAWPLFVFSPYVRAAAGPLGSARTKKAGPPPS